MLCRILSLSGNTYTKHVSGYSHCMLNLPLTLFYFHCPPIIAFLIDLCNVVNSKKDTPFLLDNYGQHCLEIECFKLFSATLMRTSQGQTVIDGY